MAMLCTLGSETGSASERSASKPVVPRVMRATEATYLALRISGHLPRAALTTICLLLMAIGNLRPIELTSSTFKRYLDCTVHCVALLSWHGNHAPVSFSAIARSELIAAFAGLTRIRIKVGAAIHTVPLRVGRSLGVSSVRQDRHQTHRKAGK